MNDSTIRRVLAGGLLAVCAAILLGCPGEGSDLPTHDTVGVPVGDHGTTPTPDVATTGDVGSPGAEVGASAEGGPADGPVTPPTDGPVVTPDGPCTPNCAGKCAGAASGCPGQPCAANDCGGCCDGNHACQGGTSKSACGTGGESCDSCGSSELCKAGDCCNDSCAGKCGGQTNDCGNPCNDPCPCTPDCPASKCGQPDGCGGTCPACPCSPDCPDAKCGQPDGCGGTCPACPDPCANKWCPDNSHCEDGICYCDYKVCWAYVCCPDGWNYCSKDSADKRCCQTTEGGACQ